MKYGLYILGAIFLVLLLTVLLNTAKSYVLVNKLTGYIEVVSDWGILRIVLPIKERQKILIKNPHFVASFDIAPNRKDRILELDGLRDDMAGLWMFQDGREVRSTLKKKSVRNPSFSPDGAHIAYVFHQDKSERKRWAYDWSLYVVNADGSSDRLVSDLALDYFRPSWFPDGKRLAVGTLDFKIYIVDIETGTKRPVIDFGTAPTVSHDGRTITYWSKKADADLKKKILDYRRITEAEYLQAQKEDKAKFREFLDADWEMHHLGIFLYDMETGQSRKLTDELPVERPVIWSPDDKYLLFNRRNWLNVTQVYVLDIVTGRMTQIPSIYGEIMAWGK